MTPARLKRAVDRFGAGRSSIEDKRKIPMVRTLSDQAAAQVAVCGDRALDHGGAAEGIKPEVPFPYRHQPVRRTSTGRIRCKHRAYPTALQTLPPKNAT